VTQIRSKYLKAAWIATEKELPALQNARKQAVKDQKFLFKAQ
jgi:hypothetical protein